VKWHNESVGYDKFELRVDPSQYVRWPEGGGYQPVEIRINGIPLIDLVRPLEIPYVEQENREDDDAMKPGDYQYLPPSLVYLPSRNLLGEPYDSGFRMDPGDSMIGKSTVLGCTCGEIECWFLVVRITLSKSEVRWSEFAQFHRDWKYELGPYTFDRADYEMQLQSRDLFRDPRPS
jgi:hypothetical protein